MDIINDIQKPKGFENIAHKKDSKVDKSGSENKAIFSGSDGVEISEEAQEIRKVVSGERSELLEFLKNNVPDVREAKVQEVREKLAQGVFDRPEVIERLAEKLASLL